MKHWSKLSNRIKAVLLTIIILAAGAAIVHWYEELLTSEYGLLIIYSVLFITCLYNSIFHILEATELTH